MIRSIILAGILVFALLTPTAVAPSFAHGHDDDGPAHGKSFKIQSFGMDKNGNPYLTVKGTAGAEMPHEEGEIFAYAFVTDAGTYAVTSHMGDDTPGEEHDELEWHAHKVVFDDKCVSSMTEDGEAEMATNRVTVLETGATSVSKVMTLELSETDAGTCITKTFDQAKKSKGPKNDIGALLYTHGDMMNHHGTPNVERMLLMESAIENEGKTPVEVVYHMPYNWDDGLLSLDSDVKYAVFMYTDMFGPNSTVIHNVTRGVFGGIPEYDYCPGVPMGDSCMYMGQITSLEPTNGQTVLVFAEPARPDHPELRDIFVKQAKAVSENPKNEILVLVGHGAKSDANDMAQQQELTNAAAFAKKKMKFADAFGVTAREDWPTLSPAAVQSAVDKIEAAMAQTGATRVVLMPATGSGSGYEMVAGALTAESIDFVRAPDPLPLGEKEFKKWAEQVMKETVNFIKKEKPTQATITPYWNRTY
ncbi:MAG: hypothetical protein QXJ74_00370 [Nitrososphaera sp.]